jgi:Flp pilus assembly pilin Flp
MIRRYKRIRVLATEDRAQDLVEYSLLAGFIAVAAGAFMPDVTNSVSVIFSRVTSLLSKFGGA